MPDSEPPSPALAAAVFLLARELVPGWSSWPATVTDALSLVGAGKSQTYEVLGRLHKVVDDLAGKPGRPRPAASPVSALLDVVGRVRDHLMSHGGAVCGTGPRRVYSDGFRRFIVGLADPGEPGHDLTVDELASSVGVPLGTLKDWLSGPREGGEDTVDQDSSEPDHASDVPDWIRVTHLRQIATLWPSWEGSFQHFCQMLRAEHRLPYGDTYVGNFLQAAGLRERRGRKRSPVEAPWSSGTFRSFFPGAQWLGDGTTITVRWGELVFCFNVEALFDPAADALVGFTVSDAEDEEALRRAFEMGVATAGSPPLALSLDNKSCNHSPGVAKAVESAGAALLRTTPGRGQAKAPLEGAFGTFQQGVPPLVITGRTPRERARCMLSLVFMAWARGRNGKPRKRLKGLTPAQAYGQSQPKPVEIQAAREWIEELHRRQERARATREARRDPVRLQLLDEGLAQLGIADPTRRLAVSLAYYGREAIARGLATFRAKLDLGTIPPDADHGRYLGGIIRRLHTRLELDRCSDHLLQQRIRLHDISLEPLERSAAQLRENLSDSELPASLVDQALRARYRVDFRYWAETAAAALGALPQDQRISQYRSLSRRIAACFKVERERREDLIDRLAESTATAQD